MWDQYASVVHQYLKIVHDVYSLQLEFDFDYLDARAGLFKAGLDV